MPGHEIYVYYKAAEADAAALEAAVRTMQDGLRLRHAGLGARLLCRAELQEGLQTWMETYRLPPGMPSDALATHIEAAASAVLVPWLRGPRHVEHFMSCAS